MTDTAAKRFAAMNFGSPWRGINVLPDSTISGTDRAVINYMYMEAEEAAIVATSALGGSIYDVSYPFHGRHPLNKPFPPKPTTQKAIKKAKAEVAKEERKKEQELSSVIAETAKLEQLVKSVRQSAKINQQISAMKTKHAELEAELAFLRHQRYRLMEEEEILLILAMMV